MSASGTNRTTSDVRLDPRSAVERKLDFGDVRAVDDPKLTWKLLWRELGSHAFMQDDVGTRDGTEIPC